jgi:hypothetical protein
VSLTFKASMFERFLNSVQKHCVVVQESLGCFELSQPVTKPRIKVSM